MPRLALLSFCRSLILSFRLLTSRIIHPLALLEQRVHDYCMKTTPRRRASRLAGIVMFACMSVGLMGNNSCQSCTDGLRILGVPAIITDTIDSVYYNVIHGYALGVTAKPRFKGTDGSQTGTAAFTGNFTAITQNPGSYFFMLRMQDCSLSQVVATSTLNGQATATGQTTNYERVLHQLAGLKTTAGVFAKGCADNSVGISSRIGVALPRKAGSTMVLAMAAGNGGNNAVFIATADANINANFNPIATMTAATSLATADLNGDGNGDLVVVNGYNAASAYVSVMLGNGDGTFHAAVNYAIAGNLSEAATIADVNGDGKLDIVAVSDDQHISVLLGNGDGTFQNATSFAAPALPGFVSSASTPILGLIAADLNNDGKMDIVCSNGLVLLGNGNGTFAAVATPAFPYSSANPGGFGPGLASGDINNDGKMDLVLNTGPAISTWIGKGDGTFTQGQSYASINDSGYVTITDFDGDGNLDLYTGLANSGLYSGDDSLNSAAYVLMGNGDGTFVGAPVLSTGAYNGTNLGDVNGDGVPDLITANPGGGFTVQLGNGKGAFTAASTVTAPPTFVLDASNTLTGVNTTAPATYAVADINGDGKADLVFIDQNLADTYNSGGGFFRYNGGPIIFTAISNGDGTFQTPVGHAFPQIAAASGFDNTLAVSGLQIADINHDGKNDLILTYNETGGGTGVNAYNQGFAVLTGNGNGTFSTTPILTSTYSSNTAPTTSLVATILSTTDLNADNKPDLIVNVPGTAIINFQLQTTLQTYIGNGDGTFKTPTTVAVGANSYGLPTLADFNKDGKLDLAVLAETSAGQAELVVALGNGNGTFATPTISNLTGGDAIRSASLVAADFDADTKPDLALFDAHDYSGVFYGKGDGTFTSVPGVGYIVPKDLLSIAAGSPAVAVDLNKDTHPDILAGSTVLLNLYGNAPVVTASTTTALTASASTITVGSSITFTATITPSGSGTPTGTVTFYDGATVLGTGAVNASGIATYTTTGLTTGTQSFTAVYPGDANFSTSTSPATSVTVNPATVATTTALTASGTNVFAGISITFTATVSPASGTITPTGTVTFKDGTTTLGTGTLNSSGVATYATSTLSVGAHSITASYGGATGTSVIFTASTSTAVPVTINTLILVTSTALTASSTNAVSGTSITFTATVGPTGTGFGTPTGTVTFFDGVTQLGTGTLNASGVTTYTTSALAVGTHSITAAYGGVSGSFAASTSTAFAVTITAAAAPDFAISLNAASTTVTHGSPATTTVTITPSGGFTAAVNVVCAGAPANSNCAVSGPNPISPVGAGPASTTVTLQTSITTGSLRTRIQRYSLAGLPLGLLTGLTLFFLPRKRRPAIFGLIVATTAGLLSATGCGSKAATSTQSTVTTPPGTYTLTLTGTSGTTTHSTPWTVIVQ